MAIIYSYPQTAPIQGNELFVVSSRTTGQPTMSIELSQIIDYIPTVLDLDTFSLFGHGFTIPPTIVNNDVITYNSTNSTWEAIPVPNPVIPTEIYTVTAGYDSGGNTYNGTGTPTVTQYESNVIYNTTFDTTNTTDGPTMSIDGLAPQPLVVIDNTGVPQPIPIGTIVNNQIYYISSYNNNFQLSTTPPPPDDNPVVYWNPNAISIDSGTKVGGVIASTLNNPVTWEKPDGTGYTFQECMDRIFYPYQSPTLTGFKIDGVTNRTLEVGTIFAGNPTNHSFSWNYTFAENVDTNTGAINGIPENQGSTNPISTPIVVDPADLTGNGSYLKNGVSIGTSFPNGTAGLTHGSNMSWKLSCDDIQGAAVTSNSTGITWYWKWFYGRTATYWSSGGAHPTYNDLNTGIGFNSKIANKASLAATNLPIQVPNVNEYIYVIVPQDYSGTLKIYDGNNNQINNSFVSPFPVSITNTTGNTTTYDVYASINLAGNVIIKVTQ